MCHQQNYYKRTATGTSLNRKLEGKKSWNIREEERTIKRVKIWVSTTYFLSQKKRKKAIYGREKSAYKFNNNSG